MLRTADDIDWAVIVSLIEQAIHVLHTVLGYAVPYSASL